MRAWTLMTALPPTKGHLNLIKFVEGLSGGQKGRVLICTQPGEPYVYERVQAVKDATRGMRIEVIHMHRTIPQDPKTPGFWPMWKGIMQSHGFEPGDIFSSSEYYGARLATELNGRFMPFDPERELYPSKATMVREDVWTHFKWIVPEFQKNLLTTVTIFGAESTGKTTLSKALANAMGGHWVYEWARPYLETVAMDLGPRKSRLGDLGTDINVDSMTDIWLGQSAVQRLAQTWTDKPFVVQDTDLYSTIGYWEQPHWQNELGTVPEMLVLDAKRLQSDLYIITRANIPFEEDPLRYGGTKQESPDSYWIGVAEKYGLNYVVLDSASEAVRQAVSMEHMRSVALANHATMYFDRHGF